MEFVESSDTAYCNKYQKIQQKKWIMLWENAWKLQFQNYAFKFYISLLYF